MIRQQKQEKGLQGETQQPQILQDRYSSPVQTNQALYQSDQNKRGSVCRKREDRKKKLDQYPSSSQESDGQSQVETPRQPKI